MRRQDEWKLKPPVRRPPGKRNDVATSIHKVLTNGRELLANVASYQPETPFEDSTEPDSYSCQEYQPQPSTVKPNSLCEERSRLLTTLQETFHRCQHPVWDGEQAEAISVETLQVARRFIEALPRCSPLPTITPEPDGQLDFERYLSPRRMLTVSVSSTGTLYWAALIGSDDPRGSCQFADQFPKTLSFWVSQVFE